VVILAKTWKRGRRLSCHRWFAAKFGGPVVDTPWRSWGSWRWPSAWRSTDSSDCEIQFEGFLYPCLDQINNHIGRIRNRSRGRLRAPVIRVPYGGGIHAPEHHSDSPEAILAHIPGIKSSSPQVLTKPRALCSPQFEIQIRDLHGTEADLPRHTEEVPEGIIPFLWKSQARSGGKDVTVVAWGQWFGRH